MCISAAWQHTPLLPSFALFALLLAGLSRPDAHAQEKVEPTDQFRFTEVLAIGDDESAPIEYLFSNPQHIRTDAEGRIYVAEQRDTRIRVFDSGGVFLGMIGREGEGPGEFRDIQALALDAEGRIIVYDRTLRRFTCFPPFEEIDSLPVPDPEGLETVRTTNEYAFAYGLPDGRLVSLYQPRHNQYSPDQPRLHVYDEDLDHAGAFGAPSEWDFSDDAFSRELVRSSLLFGGSHVAPGRSILLLAPKLYGGLLYQYTSDGDGTWVFQRLEGRAPRHPTHEVVEYEPEGEFPSIVFSGGLGARYRSVSHGVGQLSDGRVVHLSTSEDDSGIRQLQLELFDANGVLDRAGPIDGFEHDETAFEEVKRAVRVFLLWVDREDRLYLVDTRTGFPIIRVMELEE